jgi:hypothetical protein
VSAIVSLEVGCTHDAVVIPTAPVSNCQVKTIKNNNNTVLYRMTYDAQNRISSISTREGGGNQVSTYNYNSNGLAINEIISDTLGIVRSRVEYTYNTANKLVRREYFQGANSNSVSTMEYDASMRIVRNNRLQADTIKDYSIIEYSNATDLPSKSTGYSKYNGTIIQGGYTFFTYDASGNLLNSTSYGSDNVKRETSDYTYDNKKLGYFVNVPGAGRVSFASNNMHDTNNVISFVNKRFSADGSVSSTKTSNISYTYDANNYPITRTASANGVTATDSAAYNCN